MFLTDRSDGGSAEAGSSSSALRSGIATVGDGGSGGDDTDERDIGTGRPGCTGVVEICIDIDPDPSSDAWDECCCCVPPERSARRMPPITPRRVPICPVTKESPPRESLRLEATGSLSPSAKRRSTTSVRLCVCVCVCECERASHMVDIFFFIFSIFFKSNSQKAEE
jgi:hypothetical protein